MFASGRFQVSCDRRDTRLARALLTSAALRDSFPGLPRPQRAVLIEIAPDARTFVQRAGPAAPEWGAAVAIPEQQRVVMQGGRAGSDAGDPMVALRHELAHLALHEVMGQLPPRWFDEGYASYAANEWTRDRAFETSLGMVWHTLPSRDALEEGFAGGAARAEWSYAVAYRVVSELAQLDTLNRLDNFFRDWKLSGSFEAGLRSAFGITGVQFDRHWQQRTRQRYGALAVVANLSLVGGAFALLLGPLFWMRRRRDRRRLEAMRLADARQEAALEASALTALMAEPAQTTDGLPL